MIKVLEDLTLMKNKQKILECIEDITDICTLLKSILPQIQNTSDIQDISDVILLIDDELNGITLDTGFIPING